MVLLGQVLTLYLTDLTDVWEILGRARVAVLMVGVWWGGHARDLD